MGADTVGITEALFRYNNWNQKNLRSLTFVLPDLFFFMSDKSDLEYEFVLTVLENYLSTNVFFS